MAGGFSSCGAWAQYLCLCLVAIMHVGPSFPQPEIRLQSLHRRSDSQPLDTREVPILLFLIFGKVYLFFFFVLISLPKGLSILSLLFFSKNQLLVLFSGFIFSHFVFNNFCPYLYYFFSSAYFGFHFLCSVQHTDHNTLFYPGNIPCSESTLSNINTVTLL